MTKTTEDLLKLAEKERDAITDASIAAEDRAITRNTLDTIEREELAQSHNDAMDATTAYHGQLWKNQGEIIDELERQSNEAKEKDAVARRRENAYRYISGLGDTLSSVANLVGTANMASNQNQTYNSNAVVQKAEEARKARKLEMDDLSRRLEEMQARQRELKAAGSLAVAQLKVSQAKEMAALKSSQRQAAENARYKERQIAVDETNAQANLKRAEASETNAETKANKPATTAKPEMVVVMDADGNTVEFDVSRYKNFDKDYQKALDASIADGTSGLSPDEIEEYQKAVKLAKADSGKALTEFLRTHTYRKSVIDRMGGTGANNPKYQ